MRVYALAERARCSRAGGPGCCAWQRQRAGVRGVPTPPPPPPQVYDPILAWANEELGVQLKATHSLFVGSLGEGEAAVVRAYLSGLDRWHLAAAEQLGAACKSVLIGLATVKGRLGVDGALAAARVEEDHQVAEWGLVEGGHDIDIADLRVRVAAPALFVRLLHDPASPN